MNEKSENDDTDISGILTGMEDLTVNNLYTPPDVAYQGKFFFMFLRCLKKAILMNKLPRWKEAIMMIDECEPNIEVGMKGRRENAPHRILYGQLRPIVQRRTWDQAKSWLGWFYCERFRLSYPSMSEDEAYRKGLELADEASIPPDLELEIIMEE